MCKKNCMHGGRVLNGNRLVCGFHSCRRCSVMGHPVNISALYFAFVYSRGSSKWYTVAALYQRQSSWKANCGPGEELEKKTMENEAGGLAKLVMFHMMSPTNTKATNKFLSYFGRELYKDS